MDSPAKECNKSDKITISTLADTDVKIPSTVAGTDNVVKISSTAVEIDKEIKSPSTVPETDSEIKTPSTVAKTDVEDTTPLTVAETDVEVETSEVISESNNKDKNSDEQSEEGDKTIESFEDIDLGAIEIAASVLEEMEKSLKPSEAYENFMGACSSTAQALKQSISDVLRSRETIVITDCTSELEESLSQKIADFETVVSGSFVTRDIKAELTNIKHPAFSNVIITEVDDSAEDANIGDTNTTSSAEDSNINETNTSTQVTEETKSSPNNSTTELNSETVLSEKVEDSNRHNIENSNKTIEKEVKGTQTLPVQAETVPIVNSAAEDKKLKKQSKVNSNKKKGTIDQILKSLSNYSTTEEKLQALCKKHIEVLEESRLMEPRMKQLERQVQSQQKEKEQLQADHNRMVLAKSRLESLCRELQRQNKCIKEENLLRIKEEEEKRKEIANKFHSTLTDISALMQEHSKKNHQLREENAELAKKLKALVDHYDTWEKHMEKIVQQNHLEAQLAKAKHAKVNLLLKQETEKFLKEKQALLENMSELQKRCTLLTSNELKLRTELGDYTSKYEEFQTVLNKSSQVFASFKTDMEATSKKIKKLEKETNVYKQKWESSNNALLGMINDKQKHEKELSNAQQRIATLEKLCRALQAERNELQNQLNAVTSSVNLEPNDVPPTPVET